jgi:hypothetical protein
MRRPALRKVLKWLMWMALSLMLLATCAAGVFALHCSPVETGLAPSPPSSIGKDIPGYSRPEDDSFLEWAEWYIVWSYQEKANWQRTRLPSGFPYFGAIGQYWSGYCSSWRVVRGKYPFNFGDHLMLAVIGSSFTIEYGLKGAYEETVGRLSEALVGGAVTDEDRYAASVAANYGAFVGDRPFYEFSFASALQGLWTRTSFFGPHLLRKLERRVWLSLDYGIEAIYCGLITLASHAAYGVEDNVTWVLAGNIGADSGALAGIPDVTVVRAASPDTVIVRMPRYQKFTNAAILALGRGIRFREIAGNRQIVVSAVVPAAWSDDLKAGEVLFSSPILTNPALKRVALRVPVSELQSVTAVLPIEHIYDY